VQNYEFAGYQVEIDRTATHNWYADFGGWACECGHCRNFLALARRRELPNFVLHLLDDLGIPPEKATYVCEMYHDDAGLLYQFSYRLSGTILAEPQKPEEKVRCCHEPYPYGAPDFPQPHFDLEFWVTLPWILHEPLNG